MLLQQICPGKSNGHIQSFYTALWDNTRYIIYGAANKIVIHNGDFIHLQTIDVSNNLKSNDDQQNDEIISVGMSEDNGKIAVTFGTKVVLFEPSLYDMSARWNLSKVLLHDCSIYCTSWGNNNGQLLVGGDKFIIWQSQNSNNQNISTFWEKIWEQELGSKIIHMQISPDNKLIATIGKHDRLVKVWWLYKSVETKTLKSNFNDGFDRYTPIHWIHPKEFLLSIQIALDSLEGELDDSVIGARLKKFQKLALDTPDLFYQIQHDGTMIIWGIRNLYCRPRRIPKVFVLLRINPGVPLSDVEYFFGSTAIYHEKANNISFQCLVELTIVAQNNQGRINCYAIRLVDLFDLKQNSSPLNLKNSWTGHHSDITTIIKAPRTDSFVSLAKDDEIILWDINNTEKNSQFIVEKSPFSIDSKIKLVCVLPEYDPSFELMSLFSFELTTSSTTTTSTTPQETTKDLSKTYIAGVSSHQNIVFCWNIIQNSQDTLPPTTAAATIQSKFISKSKLPITNKIIGAVAVEQWTGIHSRLYRVTRGLSPPVILTFTDDGYIRYWQFIDIDWLYTSNAELVLAIATSQKISIYTRKHYTNIQASWTLISEIDMNNQGSLIVANGNQLRCYNKWLSREDLKKVLNITGVNKYPTLFHVVDYLNGPLPHHHPTLLIQHILWGRMELVKQILAHLYKYMKLLLSYDKPITTILPMPFDKLFGEDKTTSTIKTRRYSLLFDEDSDDDGSQESTLEFTQEVAEFLSEKLKSISLPDLSHVEQAQLLALVDTIIQVESQKRSLDENGVRYVLFMRRYHYLHRSKLTSAISSSELSFRDMAWALHSESQDLLIEYSTMASGGKFFWKDARVHGIFLWIRNIDTIRQQMEIIARNHYMAKEERDPTDCSLFYMALKKKKLLLGLWRTANHHKEQAVMLKFLANNFDESKWKTAALKNAYLKDAVNVCLKYLDDFHLAIAICRVYEGDSGPVLTSVFKEHIIPLAVKTGDRWLASLSFWFLNQRDKAVKAIMLPLETLCDADQTVPESQISTSNSPDAALIVLYKQLKEKSVQTLRGAAEISAETEFFFVLRTIFAYDRIGCPLLALHLVKSWTFPPEEVSLSKNPNHILRSRRRTTILDIPLPNDDPISSGVVSIDTWSWDPPITPTSPEASKSITDKAIDAFSDEPQHIRHQRVGSFSRKTSLDFNNNSLNNEDDDNNIWSWNSPKSFQNYVKRLAQQLLNAVEIISKDPELFNNSSYYSDYINKLEQGLSSICKSVKIIYIIINLKSLFLSFTRCLETDAYDLLEHFKSYKEDNKSKKSSSAYS
nr:7162_t:CDS:10 [Entrophospora candida]